MSLTGPNDFPERSQNFMYFYGLDALHVLTLQMLLGLAILIGTWLTALFPT